MSSYFAAVNSFNAGELSPKMLARTDVSQYSKGCIKLENFFVTPYGSVERRPGTLFLDRARSGTSRVRLIRFVYSSEIAYCCEFGSRYIRFYRDGQKLDQELSAPYSADVLSGLQFVQSADIMTIVHPQYPPMELRRITATEFTLTPKEYEYPPVLDPNTDDNATIKPSDRSGDITLTASKPIFTAANVGGFYEIVHTRKENEISKDFKANGTSSVLEVYGFWTFTTHGTWTGTISIERSFDGGNTWSKYRTYSSANDSNTSTSGEEEERNVLYRLRMEDYQQSSSGTLKLCRALFVNPDFVVTGVVKITDVSDSQHASGEVTQKLGDTTATAEWSEGAWSNRRGYPRAVAYYEERMIFAGTADQPQRVWGSHTGDWDNFLTGSKDDDGLDFTLASDTVNEICWLCQHDALVIGTNDAEWTLSNSGDGGAITPSNFQIKRQSVYGSGSIPACMAGDVILFMQRGGRKIREFCYSLEKNGYVSPDLTILADHITATGIVEISLQQLPDTILWCLLSDGSIAAMTYERDQEVVGWHRHTTQGKIISMCIVPHGEEDWIYMAVQRAGGIYIELMGRRKSGIYLDSAIEFNQPDNIIIAGLEHLEGQKITILADGAVAGTQSVASGCITLDQPAENVIIGLPYASMLSPMPIELDTQRGTTMLHRKTIGEIRIRIYDSVGGMVRAGEGAWQTIISRDVNIDDTDTAIGPKTETVKIIPAGGYEESTSIEIKQEQPLPLNISNLIATYEVVE